LAEVQFTGKDGRLVKSLLTPQDKVRILQRKLYAKSKKEKGFRFYSLYDKVYQKEVLEEAWAQVKANKGAAGIDGKTIKKIKEDGEEKFILDVESELRAETYQPKAVRRVWIPKRDGKKRPLGIPTVKDRLVQTAVKIVIEPIFEADFQDCSYGFRPKRNALQATEEIRKYLGWGLGKVVDTDIDNFFNKITHWKLMWLVSKRMVDKKILRLISKWLKSGIMEEGTIQRNTMGTPQGGVISPLLANIYLNELDRTWKAKKYDDRRGLNAQLVRYADDLVILTNKDADIALETLRKELKRLDLQLKDEKTRVIKAETDSFDFLGYNFRRVWNRERTKVFALKIPSQRAVKSVFAKIRQITANQPTPVQKVVDRLNPVLRGWMNYFRVGNSGRALAKVQQYAVTKLRRFIRRQSKKRGFGGKEIPSNFLYKKLGLYYDLKVKWSLT